LTETWKYANIAATLVSDFVRDRHDFRRLAEEFTFKVFITPASLAASMVTAGTFGQLPGNARLVGQGSGGLCSMGNDNRFDPFAPRGRQGQEPRRDDYRSAEPVRTRSGRVSKVMGALTQFLVAIEGEEEPQGRDYEPRSYRGPDVPDVRRSALGVAIEATQADFDEGKAAGAFPGWEEKRNRNFGLIASAIGAARRADRNGDDRAGYEALRQAREVLDEVRSARKAARVVPYRKAGDVTAPTIMVEEPTGRIVAEQRQPVREQRQERDNTPPPPAERAPRKALGIARHAVRELGREEDLGDLVQATQDLFDEARKAEDPDKLREATMMALSVVAMCHDVPEEDVVSFARAQLAIWETQWELDSRKETGAFDGRHSSEWGAIVGALRNGRDAFSDGAFTEVVPALEPAWQTFAALDREGEAAGRTIGARLQAKEEADKAAAEALRAQKQEADARRERLLAQIRGEKTAAPATAPASEPQSAPDKGSGKGKDRKTEAEREKPIGGRGAARRRVAEEARLTEEAGPSDTEPIDEVQQGDDGPTVRLVAGDDKLATIGDILSPADKELLEGIAKPSANGRNRKQRGEPAGAAA